MGVSFSSLFKLLWSKKEVRVLILGLVCSCAESTHVGFRI